MGATDPTSGTASINEVIRGFGALLAQGWKPLRTVVFASWDAEEVCGYILTPQRKSLIIGHSMVSSEALNGEKTSRRLLTSMSSHISTSVSHEILV